jgi:hypothetical protein
MFPCYAVLKAISATKLFYEVLVLLLDIAVYRPNLSMHWAIN